MITLKASARDVKVKPKMVRKAGKIPAVFYGPGCESTPIAVDRIEFTKVFHTAGESTIISLATQKKMLDALIHDIELDPVTGDPIHIDFYIVAKDHKIEVSVPVEYVGIAPATKLGGIVMKIMHEIDIEALPNKLPQHIIVDLSTLEEIDSRITIADIDFGEGVKPLVNSAEVVAVVTLPQEEKETTEGVADLSAIEVEKKGKKEEESLE